MRKHLLTGGVVFSISFVVYVATLCPTIYWEDSAAFCAVNSLLGISHSPGFPIYVILGRIFTILPLADSAFYSNLMSAFWGSISLAILFILILKICNKAKVGPWLSKLTAITAVLLLAFSSSFWLQAVRAEVYSLNVFFSLTLLLILLRWRQLREFSHSLRWLLLGFFVFGLSLTNHPLLMISLAPALLLFVLLTDHRPLLKPWTLLLSASFLLLGLSVYFYLPIRSSLLPAINWGKPDSWSNLITYLFRTSQSVSSPSVAGIPYFSRLWFNLSFPADQFGLPLFWLGVVGLASLFKSSLTTALTTFSIFMLNIGTATWAADFSLRNYDLLGYLLPSLSMFAVWFAVGLETVSTWIIQEVRAANFYPQRAYLKLSCYLAAYALPLILLVLPFFQLSRNIRQCNKRSQDWAYRYASQILNSVDKDALILAGDDNTLTSLWYLNLSERKRQDVKILSPDALTNQAYVEQLRCHYSEIQFPETTNQNPAIFASELSRLNADRFPVYCTYFSGHPSLVKHLRPTGYLFELSPNTITLTDKDIKMQENLLKRSLQMYGSDVVSREHFGNLIFNLGAFYDRVLGSHASVEYFLWALDIDPSNSRIYFQLGKAFLKNGDKIKASRFLQAGLELEPYNSEAIRLLEKT